MHRYYRSRYVGSYKQSFVIQQWSDWKVRAMKAEVDMKEAREKVIIKTLLYFT